ncbi:hypothetical protein ABEB36_006049 [Hypothenemus hampei]|uniref:Secreted protein n=1 Tax=Hypothenemus hampei TaxID=57062 RepID=A0ABD1F0A9_HYPHA
MINLVWVIYFLLHIYERACTTCIGLCREILTAMQEPSKTRCYYMREHTYNMQGKALYEFQKVLLMYQEDMRPSGHA